MRKTLLFWIFPLLAVFFAQSQSDGKERYFPPNSEAKTLDMGSGCKIQMKLPKDAQAGVRLGSSSDPGRVGIGLKDFPNAGDRWGMDLQCYDSVDDYVVKGWATLKSGRWRLNINEDTVRMIEINALRLYNLHAVNSSGWAVAYDDTTGDEQFRRRTLAYCLIKNNKAVCGESQVGFLESIQKNRRSNLTKNVLKILEDTEFLNDRVSGASGGSNSIHHQGPAKA